jgi:NAD(P)H-dependent FMN reductase/GNAT superfamily N-acetyltransferase
MKRILAICGSTRTESANLRLLRVLAQWAGSQFDVVIFEGLAGLPHFSPDLDMEPLPEAVAALRQQITEADGVIICTPEYVFSLPGSLKNALEWLVSTVLFEGKPTGLITASASGEKGHEQLLLVMRTLSAAFTDETQLLIKSVKAKVGADGLVKDPATEAALRRFWSAMEASVLGKMAGTAMPNTSPPAYTITTDRSKLDLPLIHRYLSEESYWSKGIPMETVRKSIGNSLCFGVFQGENQVGFARVISDFASFAYLADVFILPAHRGQGLSKMLMNAIHGHPDLQGLRRWMLATADAHGLYRQFGWKELAAPERFMERHAPDIYRKP